MEGSSNLALTFFVWWYGEALAMFFAFLKSFLIYITDLFSVRLLFKTLFAPWRRDRLSYEGLSLQDRFQIILLNLSSRFVGFCVKVAALTSYLIVFVASLFFCALAIIVWLTWPILSVILLVGGVKVYQAGLI